MNFLLKKWISKKVTANGFICLKTFYVNNVCGPTFLINIFKTTFDMLIIYSFNDIDSNTQKKITLVFTFKQIYDILANIPPNFLFFFLNAAAQIKPISRKSFSKKYEKKACLLWLSPQFFYNNHKLCFRIIIGFVVNI